MLDYDKVYSAYEDKKRRSVCAGCGSYYVVTSEQLAHDQAIVNKLLVALKAASTQIHNLIPYEEGEYREILQHKLSQCLEVIAEAEGE